MEIRIIQTNFYDGDKAYTEADKKKYEALYGNKDYEAFDHWQFDSFRKLSAHLKALDLRLGMKVAIEVLGGKKPLTYTGMIDQINYGMETFRKYRVYDARPILWLRQHKTDKLVYGNSIGKITIYE